MYSKVRDPLILRTSLFRDTFNRGSVVLTASSRCTRAALIYANLCAAFACTLEISSMKRWDVRQTSLFSRSDIKTSSRMIRASSQETIVLLGHSSYCYSDSQTRARNAVDSELELLSVCVSSICSMLVAEIGHITKSLPREERKGEQCSSSSVEIDRFLKFLASRLWLHAQRLCSPKGLFASRMRVASIRPVTSSKISWSCTIAVSSDVVQCRRSSGKRTRKQM